jgi:hypothetical protein
MLPTDSRVLVRSMIALLPILFAVTTVSAL